MPLTISILDETSSGERSGEVDLETATLRDLIRRRIQREVEAFNQSERETFQGLVQPEESERTCNGYCLNERRKLDWQKQYEKSIRSFERNGFLVLLDDRQETDLDEGLRLSPASDIHFLKLTPLVRGGRRMLDEIIAEVRRAAEENLSNPFTAIEKTAAFAVGRLSKRRPISLFPW